MEIDDKIDAIEAELQRNKDELEAILSKIRAYLKDVPDLTPSDLDEEESQEEL